MKTLALVILATALTSFSSEAAGWACKEIRTPNTDIRQRIEVTIEENAEITKSVKNNTKWDHIYDVSVLVTRTLGPRFQVLKRFSAYARSEDVNYTMSSRAEGVRFYLYLDELDEAGIEFKDEDGEIQKIRLSCEELRSYD